MKNYLTILLLLFCIQFSIGQSEKEKAIEFFKFEMKQLSDSSAYYFDKGIKLLKEGENPAKISTLISPKLKELEIEIDKKVYSFKPMIEKFGLTQSESQIIFEQLKEIFKNNQEKYKQLTEKGVKIN